MKLETKRLILSPLSFKDIAHSLLIFKDPVAMHFYQGALTRKQAFEWIAKSQKQFIKLRQGFFVCKLKETGEFVGICGVLNRPEVDGLNENEIAYLFVQKHWRKGYAIEAARRCKEYGFDTLGFIRLVSLIDPRNRDSIRVAEKNGLKREKEVIYKGRLAMLYSIIA